MVTLVFLECDPATTWDYDSDFKDMVQSDTMQKTVTILLSFYISTSLMIIKYTFLVENTLRWLARNRPTPCFENVLW